MSAEPGEPPEPLEIGGYAVERRIAAGGMAVVYLARDAAGNAVAVKRILPHVAHDRGFRERFRHEVEIHARLSHPNVLALLEVSADPPFLAMEYVDGGTLRALLDRLGRLPLEIALIVIRDVARGLGHAHAEGVVHRDVKPQNVLLSRRGDVKVSDFGISRTEEMTKLTQTGSIIGTPSYMSPEQAKGLPLDARSDVFSTGVMLYEAVSGVNPFQAENPAATLRRVVELRPPLLFDVDPALPAEVEALAAAMLEKEPERRPASMGQVAAALEAILATLSVKDAAVQMGRFLELPERYLAVRRERLSSAHLARGKGLLATPGASPEVTLWELFLARRIDPSNAEAERLLAGTAARTGYRVDPAPPSARVAALEAQLLREPENPALLLQTGKLAKLERDFLRLMGAFFRLRRLTIADPYLAGQVTSLVARPPAQAASTAAGPQAAGPARPSPGPAGPAGVPAWLTSRGYDMPLAAGAALGAASLVLGLLLLALR